MEHMDQLQEAQVWQRVRGAGHPVGERQDLRLLLMEAADRAAMYRSLMGDHPAKQRLRKLYDGEMADMACLRGMCILSGEVVRQPRMVPGKKDASRSLEQCCHRARRAAGEYMARISDPEFGGVFGVLARRQEERCAAILEILGSTERHS